MQILIILIAIIAAFAVLNFWFGIELYRIFKLEKVDPIHHLQPETPRSRNSHPLVGSIFKVHASMKLSAPPDSYELHIMADISDAKRLFNYLADLPDAIVAINGDLFKIQYMGSDVKDACTDFVKDRCEILDSAKIVTNVYSLTYRSSLTSVISPPQNLNSDIIEYHLWIT